MSRRRARRSPKPASARPVTLTVHEWLERIDRASPAKDPDERRRRNIELAKQAHASHPGGWLQRWGTEQNAPWVVNLDLLRKLHPFLVDHPDESEMVERVDQLAERVRALENFRTKSAAWFRITRGEAGGKPGG